MNKVTVLFAGAFKPLHAGHINLINKYSNNPKVDKIKIFVSPSSRGAITQKIAYDIISRLLKNPKISIENIDEFSPVRALCKFIESANPGNYVLASSLKGDDYKRIKRIIEYYKKHDKPKGVKLMELPIDASALTYCGRLDENEGKPISSSILREDIENDNFFNFKTNYPNYDIDTVKSIWNTLRSATQ